MKQKIAIEPDLTPIRDYLSNKGYNVEQIDYNEVPPSEAEKYDAFIVSGMNSEFMGMNDTNSKAVVIDVKGMTPDQVYNELKSRLH